jgi:hypothetical protein
MKTPAEDLWALVLAGGDGTRLQPLTRLIAGAPIPKQYCRIIGDSFVMVARAGRLLALLHDVRPHDVARFAALDDAYEGLTPWNFSRDFLAHVPQHLVVARADDLGWSDWGTPEAIERTFATMGILPPWRGAQLATA